MSLIKISNAVSVQRELNAMDNPSMCSCFCSCPTEGYRSTHNSDKSWQGSMQR